MWREFVELADRRHEPFVTLCARFGVSRKTGYKWLNRYRVGGPDPLRPRSRRPKSSPHRTPDAVVDAVLATRRAHPDWTTPAVREELRRRGVTPLPAASTITLLLRRHREAVAAHQLALGPDAARFEPNHRWELLDGPEALLADGATAAPVVVRDVATGFLVGAAVLTTRREETLLTFLAALLQRHGRPWRLTLPRAPALREQPPCRAHSPLSVWLMRLGVGVEFSFAPPHPALFVADEAHRQLAARLASLPAYQRAALADREPPADPLAEFAAAAAGSTLAALGALLEQARERHNFGGKQEAMQRRTPISLYRPSPRPVPEPTPIPIYAPEADVRLVSEKGIFTFQRRLVHVGRAFAGLGVELKLTPYPDRFIVLFAGQLLGLLHLAASERDSTTSLELTPA